tara:strand:+ start:868 stop:1299 length:432 start_codon:yes stop_codon:yes gene_type:complete
MSFDLTLNKGDIKIDKTGEVSLVSSNSKLRQDIIKILLTETGDNKFHPDYGSQVGSLKIGSTSDARLVESDLNTSANKALRNLMSLQRAQSRRQQLSPGEVIVQVLDVSVTRDELDPRMYNIFVSVLTQALDEVKSNITVRLF